MKIKDVVKYVANNGYIVSYVVFVDPYGNEATKPINSEQEYKFYCNMFKDQQERDAKMNRSYNTPGNNYVAKQNPFIDYKVHKNIRVSPRLMAIILAIAIGSSGYAAYAINRNAPYYTVVDEIQTEGLFRSTKESRFVKQNAEKFEKCATALLTGNYDGVPEFDANFIKEYVHNCYTANTNNIVDGGTLNGVRFDFSFETYMTIKDMVAYETKANNPGYEAFIKESMGNFTLEDIIKNGSYKKYMDRYLSAPLEFMLQHLDPNDDEFTKLSPFARIVICEEVKSILKLQDEGYNFFSHKTPNSNINRDELIAQIDEKEESAMYYLNRQIENRSSSKDMEGRSR